MRDRGQVDFAEGAPRATFPSHYDNRRDDIRFKTLLTAAALTIAPTLTLAMGCSGGGHSQALSCADGMVYDADSNSCVKTVG